MRLQTIGENIKKVEKIDPNYLNRYKEIEWESIMKLRDLISHHYDIVDPEIIFVICKKQVPKLKATVEKIIKDLNFT